MTTIRKFCTAYDVYLFETEVSIYKKPCSKLGLPPIPQQCLIPIDGSLMTYSLRERAASSRVLLRPLNDPTMDFPEDQCRPLDVLEHQAYASVHGI